MEKERKGSEREKEGEEAGRGDWPQLGARPCARRVSAT